MLRSWEAITFSMGTGSTLMNPEKSYFDTEKHPTPVMVTEQSQSNQVAFLIRIAGRLTGPDAIKPCMMKLI